RSASAWGHLGKVLAAHEFIVEGDICFRQAEQLDPSQPRWPYYQAITLSLGNPEAAIPKLQRTVELCDCEPDRPRLRLAELLVGQGRLDDAADQLRRLLQKNANHPRAHLGLARLASLRGDLNE